MSKFPNKTPIELRQYFKEKTLTQLIEINHSYGPHFINLEERIDGCNETLMSRKEKLNELKNEKEKHDQKYEYVKQLEEQFQITRANLLSDVNGAELFLVRQSLGASPMEVYRQSSFYLDNMIMNLNTKIDSLNIILSSLCKQKTTAVSELKILNNVIDEKREELKYDISHLNSF